MVFEKFIRYAGLAVGLKPSARGCEGRLRGLYRITYSKTITLAVYAAAPHTNSTNIGCSWEGCALPDPPTGWGRECGSSPRRGEVGRGAEAPHALI